MGRACTLRAGIAGCCLLAGASHLGVNRLAVPVEATSWVRGGTADFMHAGPQIRRSQEPVLARGIAPLTPERRPAPQPAAPSAASPAPDPCYASLDDLTLANAESVEQLYFVPTDEKLVSLTFDDGPSAVNTPKILRTLAHYEVSATFFVLGERVEKLPEMTATIAAAGHELGNHTWSHPSLRSLWKSQIRDEVCRTNGAIESATGLRPLLFRPPFGRFAPSAVPLLGALEMKLVLWSADGTDWDSDDPAVVADRIVRDARPGSVILLHDSESVTVSALPLVIQGLVAAGYRIRPVGEASGLAPYRDPSSELLLDR